MNRRARGSNGRPSIKYIPVVKAVTGAVAADPTHYLGLLSDAISYIDVRGLEVGKGKAHRFSRGTGVLSWAFVWPAVPPSQEQASKKAEPGT